MDNTTKIIIGAGVLTIGGTAAYFIVKNKQKKDLDKLKAAEQGQNPSITLPGNTSSGSGLCIPPVHYTSETFPIRKGMKGKGVSFIQQTLNKYFGANLKVDSKFGCKTEAALFKATGKKQVSLDDWKKYQKKYFK